MVRGGGACCRRSCPRFLNVPPSAIAAEEERLMDVTKVVQFYPSTSVLDGPGLGRAPALFLATNDAQYLGDAQVRRSQIKQRPQLWLRGRPS